MKTQILILLFAAGVCAAQTNFDALVCGGVTYSNATIIRATPAYVVVDYDGGIVKIAITNLPASLQEKYHYDPAAEAALNEKEKEKQIALQKQRLAYQKYVAGLAGTNRVINITAMLDSFGQCQTSAGRAYLIDIPTITTTFYQLQKSISDERTQQQIMATQGQYKTASALTRHIALLQIQLGTLGVTQAQVSSVVAHPTGLSDNGIPQWQCIGLAMDVPH